jgi:flagellar basal-body rod protein FlgC
MTMALGDATRIAQSGLEVQRARMELIASNLANAQTTRTAEGGPYRRRVPIVQASAVQGRSFEGELARRVRGVTVSEVSLDPSPPVMKYEPSHPHADARGYVAYPNVDPAQEMVDLIAAVRSYQANINVVRSVGTLHDAALNISR